MNRSLGERDQDVTLGNSYNGTSMPSNSTLKDETLKSIEVHASANGKHNQTILPNGLSTISPLLPPQSPASHLKNVWNI